MTKNSFLAEVTFKVKNKVFKQSESTNFFDKINEVKQFDDIFSDKQLINLIPDGLKKIWNYKTLLK